MPPFLALFVWFVLLLLLFRYDPAKDRLTALTSWVPVIWMSIVASRLPSQWIGIRASTMATAFEEGNPLDRTIWTVLLVLAIAILLSRSFNWGDGIARNLVLVAYVLFSLTSILWSDFAFVAFKRWFRDLGSYFTILIILSDQRPYEAVRTVLRRLCYLLIPLSIVLIKYFDSGRFYDPWSGLANNVGVTTSKNMLGVLCLVSGVFFFWDTAIRWADRKSQRTRQILFVNFAFMAMTLYLLRLAHSATSAACLGIGCVVIAAAHSNWGGRHPTALKVMVPTCFCLYIVLGFGLGLNATFAEMLGRDPTLTGRTRIWEGLLSIGTNPWVGTGYESFWLGPRLDLVFEKTGQRINEAHNGYLEVYLNLGLIGLSLLVCLLMIAYRNICRVELRSLTSFGSLKLGLWAAAIFYNVTEASFKHGLMWLGVLLGAIVLGEPEPTEVPNVVPFDTSESEEEASAYEPFADWRGDHASSDEVTSEVEEDVGRHEW
jgi:exopolysaccharide production protein ExoQ